MKIAYEVTIEDGITVGVHRFNSKSEALSMCKKVFLEMAYPDMGWPTFLEDLEMEEEADLRDRDDFALFICRA